MPIPASHLLLQHLPCSGPQACPRPCPGPNCLAQVDHEGVQLEEGRKALLLGERVPTDEDPGIKHSSIFANMMNRYVISKDLPFMKSS